MRTHYVMAQTLDHTHRSRALLYTGAAALVLTLLILFLKWRVEIPVKQEERTEIEVELNLPPDPPIDEEDGGGGGGNIAQAVGPTGAAPEASLPDGETTPAKELEADEEKEAVIAKPIVTKKNETRIVKSSPTKTPPKKEETPAPPQPKMVMGKKTKGPGPGADSPDDFNKTGNQGTGWGTGKGPGAGGGTGAGGGNGSGVGSGNGPRVTQGNRKIVKAYAFDGEMERATIFAQIRVSPEGKGTFVDWDTKEKSTHRTSPYKKAIIEYLKQIQFDKSKEEDLVVVKFNFRVN